MADELQHGANDPAPEEREAEERERQEGEAALAQSSEPPDPGLA